LSYIAGEGTGFVVTSSDNEGADATSTRTYAPLKSSADSAGQAADATSNLNNDGSYSFSFSTNDQSREEAADSHNNVRGSYSFKAKDDGQTRRVDYTAGSATGFVARGSHLLVPLLVPESAASLKYSSRGQPSITSFGQVSPSPYSSASGGREAQGSVGADGSYSFSYNAGDSSRQESADAQNNVRGSFSFKAKDDGQTRKVDYEAGAATGFVAKGSHLPVASNPLSPSTGSYSEGLSSQSSVLSPSSGSSSGSEGQEAPSGDASYSFSYNTGDQTRQEFSDVQGNVIGQFSFVAKDGIQRKVDYSAGAGKGFTAQVSSSGAPTSVDPSSQTPQNSYSTQAGISPSVGLRSDGSYSFSYEAGDHSRQESSDAQNNVRGTYSFTTKNDGQTRRVDYEAGAATGFIAQGAHLPVALPHPGIASTHLSFPSQSAVSSYSSRVGAAASSTGTQSDGSYAFSYNTADQSRQESGDAQNNVHGSFTFKAKDDGQTRRVDYEAGAATGFIAKGAHIPVSLSAPSSVPDATRPVSSNNQPLAPSSYSGTGTAAAPLSSDGSYSFSFNAGDHAREESSDHQGNIRGKYSFTSKDDGKTREVVYEAGAEKGFIAKGAHIPASGSAGSARGAFGYQATPAQGSTGSTSSVLAYQASPASQRAAADASQDGQSSGDASYSYKYQTDSSSKEESSDAQGNVVGRFSTLGGDGVSRSYQYTSRGNEGFVITGEHVPDAVRGGTAGARTGLGASSILTADARSSHTKSQDVGTATFSLQKYLPPQSPTKFGYIFDTKV
jgi:hypothetical protein